MQMSTEETVFLFDTVMLQKSQIFKDLLYEFFKNNDIMKLGFSIEGDTKYLSE